ncbi:MAG: ABC transporter permease [Nanoarchaeota archaeon]|nr:ABC transporter permease [Nanoarchaeota archaeon]
MIKDYLKFAFNSVKHRSLRAWLTIIGIIIGVASIIALITISYGMQNAIEEQFEMFGADRLIISSKGFQGPGTQSESLTEDDVETLKSMSEFKYVSPMIATTEQVEFHDEIKFLTVQALPAEDYTEAFADVDFEVVDGRMFRKGDKFSVVLGYRIAYKDVFEDTISVKNTIKIKGHDFRVIGIMEEIGNSQDDNAINMDLEALREILDDPERVDFITVQAKPGQDIEALSKKVEKKLERVRGDENFQVLTSTQILEQINNILGIIQVVLIGIAAISLIVGAVGIMNSMYTSVLERTKEIGIMKSVGAKNSDILMVFLVESGLIGLIGGIFGVLIGTGMALAVGYIADQAGFGLLKIVIDYQVLFFGLAFAFILGMASGVLPAYRASKLKPVDALRYE